MTIRLSAPEDMTASEITSGHQEAKRHSFEVHVYKLDLVLRGHKENMLVSTMSWFSIGSKCHSKNKSSKRDLCKGKTRRNRRNKADIQFSAVLWSINSEHSAILLRAVVKRWLPDFSQPLCMQRWAQTTGLLLLRVQETELVLQYQ